MARFDIHCAAASEFVTVGHFHPSQIFVSNARTQCKLSSWPSQGFSLGVDSWPCPYILN
jgi:hypothetical protein